MGGQIKNLNQNSSLNSSKVKKIKDFSKSNFWMQCTNMKIVLTCKSLLIFTQQLNDTVQDHSN
jgi:hypothetical protein